MKMQQKNINPLALFSGDKTDSLLKTAISLIHLKQLYRQGWVRKNIPPEKCESVAEHSYSVALISFLVAKTYYPELSVQKVLEIALIHDTVEALTGDPTPHDKITRAEKTKLERAAAQRLFSDMKGGQYFIDLWEEYAANKSKEAKFVRQVDRLEIALQALIYEKLSRVDMSEFFDKSEREIDSPQIRRLFKELKVLKQKP